MKPPSVFDKDFRYVPANMTDVRKTFERVRRRLAAKLQEQEKQDVVQPIERARRK